MIISWYDKTKISDLKRLRLRCPVTRERAEQLAAEALTWHATRYLDPLYSGLEFDKPRCYENFCVKEENDTIAGWNYFDLKKRHCTVSSIMQKLLYKLLHGHHYQPVSALKENSRKSCTIATWPKTLTTTVSGKPNTTRQESLNEMFESINKEMQMNGWPLF